MKKVLIMLLVIGLASSGVGLGTAFGTPVLTGIKIGTTGTNPGYGVDVSGDGNTYTVKGTGDDIWNTNDAFQYAYMQISGDFDISCCLQNFTTSNTGDGWSKAGIMVRQNIDTSGASPYALIAATAHGDSAQPNNGISWQCRRPADPPTDPQTYILGNQSGASYYQPVYLRMTRVGNIFNGYYSQDGVEWTWMTGNAELAGNLSMALTDPLYIGLASCPHNAASLSIAVFDTIQFNYGAASPVPAKGELNVDYPGPVQLSWGAIPYPETGGYIKDWKVYFGSSPHDPNVVLIGTVTEPTRQINSPTLEAGKTYYWRVDATNTVNSDVARGFWWSFTTKSARPIITKQPTDTSVAVNCLATMTVEAKSGDYADQGDMTFVWKKADGTTLKTEAGVATADPEIFSSSYSQLIPAKNDPNTYWVEVSNKNGMTKSTEVRFLMYSGTPNLTAVAIGTGNQPGVGMTRSGNTFTVIGSGDDIWNTADGFEYAYVPVSGDGSISARVVSLNTTNTDGWSKSGVMIRETLNANSTYAIMPVIPSSNGAADIFQYRTSTGGGAAAGGSPNLHAPQWVRITRSGNTFTGYYSADGVNWAQHGSVTISMGANVYAGLAVCAHSTGALNTSVFDNVSASFAGLTFWQPTNPVYDPLTPEGWVDPTKDLKVTWTKSDAAPCGGYYKVYGGLSADSMTLYGQTDPDVTEFTLPANNLPFNETIYWRVDTVVGTTTATGDVWTFDTVKQYPQIRTDVAPLTVVNAGATANLTVKASTATVPDLVPMVKYEWFFGETKIYEGVPIGPDVDGNYDCPLAVANVQLANEGYYHCVVTNTVGPTSSSNGLLLTHRLMLHYTFESIEGTNIVPDQSASNFDGTLICPAGGSAPYYSLADGGIGLGKAIKLLGPNDPNNAYITTNKKPMELGISGNFPRTVSVWAKAQAFNDGGLFDVGAYAERQNFCLRTMAATEGTWRVQYYAADADTAVIPSYNTWVHFVLVHDGVRSKLYANGKLVVDYAVTLNTDNGANFVLGRYNNDVNRFQGYIDDFRLYNYALTPEEAVGLYQGVYPGSICYKALTGDLDGDCAVDLNDFSLFAAEWAKSSL